jgi:dipeptidyl aminopeptidase/acylaminoacyl peptidase
MPVWYVTFAPGGQHLASTGTDGTVWLWDLATGERVAKFQHSNNAVQAAAFSPDGKLLAAGAEGVVLVWEIATRRQTARLAGTWVQFSPDGTLLAAESGNTVRLWDVATWRDVAALKEGKAEVFRLAFSPEGRLLATGAADGTLQLWDVAQKRQVAGSRGHASIVLSVAFSPDGRRLASGGWDGTVRLWDAARLQEMATLTGHHGPVYSLAFSPDGNTLATASADATVRLWQAPPLPALPEPAETPARPAAAETIRLFSLELSGTALATAAPEGNAYRVDVTAVDGTDSHAQFLQLFDDLRDGATYTVRFRARADAPRRVELNGQSNEQDGHLIGLQQVVPLTEEWQSFQYQFRAKDPASWNRITFVLGNRQGTVWIADFTVTRTP